MSNSSAGGWAGLAVLVIVFAPALAFADTEPLPVIISYELKKQKDAERIQAHNPKGFWVRQIVARIQDKVANADFKLKEPVTVKLSFTVAKDGHLVTKSVSKSSGVEAVDKAASAMLDNAQPFPPMPATMSDAELSFALPVRFK